MRSKVAYRKPRQNKASMLLVSMMVLFLMLVVSVKSAQLKQKIGSYAERENQLTVELEKEQKRTEDIEAYQKYTQTMAYFEEVAKNKLGLVYEGEILFRQE